jgi:arginyl-tRNA synthetase
LQQSIAKTLAKELKKQKAIVESVQNKKPISINLTQQEKTGKRQIIQKQIIEGYVRERSEFETASPLKPLMDGLPRVWC